MTHDPNSNEDPTAGQAQPPKPVPLPVIPENIPAELKSLDQWVCWRYRWDEDAEKWTKHPFNPRTGNLAKSTDPKTWTSVEFALNRYQESQDQSWRFDGIGLVLTDKNNIVGFDLDHCRDPETGDIEPLARDIVQGLPTYWEISTSGTGLRGFAFGRKPGSRCRSGDFEMYQSSRYLAITGHHMEGTTTTVEAIQEAIAAVYMQIFPPKDAYITGSHTNGTHLEYDDQILIDAARRATNGADFIALFDEGNRQRHLHDDGSPDYSRSDAALMRLLTFFTKHEEQLDRLFRVSAFNRPKWESRADYRSSTIDLAIRSTPDQWSGPSTARNGQPPVSDEEEPTYHTNSVQMDSHQHEQETTPTRPVIQINTDMTGVVNKLQGAIRQLPKGPYLYQRAHQLSIIARGIKPPKWLRRPPDAPIIHPGSPAYIRELAAYAADWEKFDERSQKWKATLPPPWTVDTLIARPWWTFPPLEGIICAPTIRPDGSILAVPGYDPDTGLYLSIDQDTFPPIPERPTIDDARKALQQLQEVYVDFPFSAGHDKAAAVSAILSMVARFAVQGRVPLFAVRSTTRGSGKGLLIDTISMIATGRHAPRWPQTLDEEEERKRLLTVAMAGDPLIHIDNVTHPLGSAPLDMVLTAETITDRILGQHAQREAPLHAVFFASGNNMVFRGDMARRVLPVDLAPTMERPEERESFTHTPLLDWVLKQRPALVCAALTLLKAYFVAGCPKQSVKPFGSFEAWSNLIRQSLVWVDGQDPCEGRTNIEAESDPDYEQHHALLCAWHDRYGSEPKTVKAIKADIENHMVKDDDTERWIIAPAWRDLHEALIALDKRGRDIDVRAIGYALRSWQGRVVAGKQLVKLENDRIGIAVWCVRAL